MLKYAGRSYIGYVTKFILILFFMVSSVSIFATTMGQHPSEIADVIVDYMPHNDHDLDKVKSHDTVIKGHTIHLYKGEQPMIIVHTANAFVRPMKLNEPVRLYLKKFEGTRAVGRDSREYYIIAILPINQ